MQGSECGSEMLWLIGFSRECDSMFCIEFKEDGQAKEYSIHARLIFSISFISPSRFIDADVMLMPYLKGKFEAQTYRLFIHWIYYNDFTGPDNEDEVEYSQLLKLYFLAIPLGITILQNVIVDTLISKKNFEETPIPSGWCSQYIPINSLR